MFVGETSIDAADLCDAWRCLNLDFFDEEDTRERIWESLAKASSEAKMIKIPAHQGGRTRALHVGHERRSLPELRFNSDNTRHRQPRRLNPVSIVLASAAWTLVAISRPTTGQSPAHRRLRRVIKNDQADRPRMNDGLPRDGRQPHRHADVSRSADAGATGDPLTTTRLPRIRIGNQGCRLITASFSRNATS